jgi:hypothetical protein
MALGKLELSIAQPTLEEMQFRDTTPINDLEGWAIPPATVGTDITLYDGYKIELEHHEVGPFGQLIFNEDLKPNIFDQPKSILIEDWPDPDVSSLEKYPDGIYILKYNPRIGGVDALPQPFQTILLACPACMIEYGKLLIKYKKLEYGSQKERLMNILNKFRVAFDVCQNEVLLDQYTSSCESYKTLVNILAEAKGEY